MRTRYKYYFVPKESILNTLDFNAETSGGKIKMRENIYVSATGFPTHEYSKGGQYFVYLTLEDFVVPANMVVTPDRRGYLGKLGTKLTIESGTDAHLDAMRRYVDQQVKRYEL